MKVGNIIICFLLTSITTRAQLLLGNAGTFTTNSGTQLQWSIGESFIGSYATGGHFLSIGFQQPITVDVVGLEESEILSGISLYPNPLYHFIYVELPVNLGKEYTLTINSLNGTPMDVVTETEVGRLKVDATKWASGIYLLSITHKQQRFTTKIIKL